MALNIAAVSQSADKDVVERFVNGLRADLTDEDEEITKDDEFDRTAIERLRGRIGRR